MGVKHLWRTLERGGAVEVLDGGDAAQHDVILEELEGSVVAVDLSAWLVQAQTQPALAQAYDSDFACALKVVFDRTIHWLRHGCLPLFVIEGATPPAKLEKLRQRCMAAYGPSAAQWRVGNSAGSRFSSLGRKVAELLDCLGVPWVQAEGEGEATCAALNMCGWAQGCSTADVDALLFGAVTVYRTLALSTANARVTQMARCRRGAVQRVLGLKRGGAQALVAVAQLAGGDYDVAGAERVGDVLALAAVRCLLKGREDDADVLGLLQAALARGPDPRLDALTKCTGCKCCGHEGGRKGHIKRHGKEGCAECGTAGGGGGCVPLAEQRGVEGRACGCEFHRTGDERLLNRVVRRAVGTAGFLDSCRVAAQTYASEARSAAAAVQRAYGLARPGGANVFTWRRRPDVRGVHGIMERYIPDWGYSQVRLKLLPLLLEWDVRCGPAPPPGCGAQLRPAAIKKVSGARSAKPAAAAAGGGGELDLPPEGWRYVIEVQRVSGGKDGGGGGEGGGGGGEGGGGGGVDAREEEDLEIDAAWLNNTACSRPKVDAAADGGGGGAGGEERGDEDDEEGGGGGTQGSQPSQRQASQPAGGGGSGGGGRRKPQGSLPFHEHRSVRCTLVHELWPHLVRAFRVRPAGAKARGAAMAKAPPRVKGASAGGGGAADERQLTLKDFYGVKKSGGAAKGGGRRGAGGSAPPLPPGRGLGGGAAASAPPLAGGYSHYQQQQQQASARSGPGAVGGSSAPARARAAAPAGGKGAAPSGPMDRFLQQRGPAPGAAPLLAGKHAAQAPAAAAAAAAEGAEGAEREVVSLLNSPPPAPAPLPRRPPSRQQRRQLPRQGARQRRSRGSSEDGDEWEEGDAPAGPRLGHGTGASQPIELDMSSDGEAASPAEEEPEQEQRRQQAPPALGGCGASAPQSPSPSQRPAAAAPAAGPAGGGNRAEAAGGLGGAGGRASPEELPLMERLLRHRLAAGGDAGEAAPAPAPAPARAPRFKSARGAAASSGGAAPPPTLAPAPAALGAAAPIQRGSSGDGGGPGKGSAVVQGAEAGEGEQGEPFAALLASPPKKACTPDAKLCAAQQRPSPGAPAAVAAVAAPAVRGSPAGAPFAAAAQGRVTSRKEQCDPLFLAAGAWCAASGGACGEDEGEEDARGPRHQPRQRRLFKSAARIGGGAARAAEPEVIDLTQ
ncbi:MAG: hypothetical protein J3K34DRAFT_510633 [Monoraphidium minutum]|nr:MAG: hypothetical protein J3K34DRAFT_510633 [Monoraphidium minutum]